MEGAALRVGVVTIDARADDQLTLVGLAHINVDRVRHDDAIEDRLHGLGHQRLQRMALDREPHTRHARQHGVVPGCDDRKLAGADETARGFNTGDAAPLAADRGHLAILNDVDAAGVGRAGIAPGDRIVARDAAAALQSRAQHRVARFGGDIEDRTKGFHLRGI